MWVICCKNRAHHSIEQLTQQNIIKIGQFNAVHKLNGSVVRKIPLDKSDAYNTRAVEIEAQVYRHLGRHKCIARCLQCRKGYIDLQHEANGDLDSYLRNHCRSDRFRHRMARQTIEAVSIIHNKCVIPSDLSAQQFLVDK
ncbi:hypothetical protein BDV36DRAFT_211877 [Aspergillus pseudocaelatus]|uniref:Protein kinase domain-containing protein n=1 Tax=Aspergillus pseudocaelatus TaxID=1825620 RepID=A0ABQ6X090_9EURO|nr:hypothetical protein BDV36DRAFT_211877 [Aspergillus pseudocaelatus]